MVVTAKSRQLSVQAINVIRKDSGYVEFELSLPLYANNPVYDHTGWMGRVRYYPFSGEPTVHVVSQLAESSLLWTMWHPAVIELLKELGLQRIEDADWEFYIGRYGKEWRMSYPGDSAALQQAANDTCPHFNQARQ